MNMKNQVSCISTHAKPRRAVKAGPYFDILTKSASIISRMAARLECERRPLEYGRVRQLQAMAEQWLSSDQCSRLLLSEDTAGWLLGQLEET